MAAALIAPIVGHAEGIALWIYDFIQKLERQEVKPKIEKKEDS